jgi:hypothetical protein
MDINRNNYQQYLLREVDDELSAAEKAALRGFLQAHPALQQELTLLRDTKLSAEEVPFPDKASLYHRQIAGKPSSRRGMYRRIVLAAACAAAVCLAAVYLWQAKSPAGAPATSYSPVAGHPDSDLVQSPVRPPQDPAPVPHLATIRAADKPGSGSKQNLPEPPAPAKPRAPAPPEIPTLALRPLSRPPAAEWVPTISKEISREAPEISLPAEQNGEAPEVKAPGVLGTAEALAQAKDELDEAITEKVATVHRSTRDWMAQLAKKGITVGNLTIALKD